MKLQKAKIEAKMVTVDPSSWHQLKHIQPEDFEILIEIIEQ